MLELENIIEQIKDKREEKAQLEQLLEDKVKQLKAALDSKTEQIDKDIYYLTQAARAEFEQMKYKETPTLKKISLLSGDFVIKKARQVIKPNEDVLTTGPAYLIKIKEVKTFDWAKWKTQLKEIDGHIIDTVTGVIDPPGAYIEDVPEEVVIK